MTEDSVAKEVKRRRTRIAHGDPAVGSAPVPEEIVDDLVLYADQVAATSAPPMAAAGADNDAPPSVDEAVELDLTAQAIPAPSSVPDRPIIKPSGEFDEDAYLQQNPDVAAALAVGLLPSALFHYRLSVGVPKGAQAKEASAASGRPLSMGVDAVFTSPTGALFLIGWADDRRGSISRIEIEFESGRIVELPAQLLLRSRRSDADETLGIRQPYHLGYCGLIQAQMVNASGIERPRSVRILTLDGARPQPP